MLQLATKKAMSSQLIAFFYINKLRRINLSCPPADSRNYLRKVIQTEVTSRQFLEL